SDGNSGNNYSYTFTASNNGTITARALTVSGVTASNKVYDALTTAALNTGSAALVGIQGSDSVTLGTGGAAGTFADKNVGTGKTVTVSGLTIGGTEVTAGDYTLTQPTTTANITARALTVSGVTASNKVYDATTTAALNTGSAALDRIQGSDSVTLGKSGP